MMRRIEIIKLAGSLDDFIDPRITKFYDFTAVHIDQVIMLHTLVCFFKLRNVFPKLMFHHEVTVQ